MRSPPDHIMAVIQDQAVEAKHLQNRTTSGAVPSLTSPISRPDAEPPNGQTPTVPHFSHENDRKIRRHIVTWYTILYQPFSDTPRNGFSRSTGLRTVGQVDCPPSGSFCCRLGPLPCPTTWECRALLGLQRTMVITDNLYRLG